VSGEKHFQLSPSQQAALEELAQVAADYAREEGATREPSFRFFKQMRSHSWRKDILLSCYSATVGLQVCPACNGA
jgi:hypothetical protein